MIAKIVFKIICDTVKKLVYDKTKNETSPGVPY